MSGRFENITGSQLFIITKKETHETRAILRHVVTALSPSKSHNGNATDKLKTLTDNKPRESIMVLSKRRLQRLNLLINFWSTPGFISH